MLSKINKYIRSKRECTDNTSIYPRIEPINNGYFVGVWFPSLGCHFEKSGSCTMCNYGELTRIHEDKLIFLIKKYFKSINIFISELLIAPSGSLWDITEVSNNLLLKI
jgi:uncharacterized Fe-S cluster-containing MiaB family protein